MRGPAVKPVVIAAGGTGGHLFPAEALAAELVARGHRVALMTDARSRALDSQAFAGRERFVLPGAGIAGRGAVRAARAAVALAAGVLRARTILARLDAAAVVGFGGYPSVAPVLGARLLRHRPPVLLHEQNAVLGRANRFLARHAAVLALSFSDTTRVPAGVATEVTGNPVRPAIAALASPGTSPGTSLSAFPGAAVGSGAGYVPPEPGGAVRLLVLGGSLGARVFSDVVPAALAALPPALRARLRIVQQCRAEDLARVQAAYAAAGLVAELAPFFADVAVRLAQAHLVISRAGASSVAELAVAGRPALLVPLPGAIDDHQSANARALVAAGAAEAVAQADFTAAALTHRLGAWLSEPARLAAAAAAASGVARVDAAARLADLVERVMHREGVGGPAGEMPDTGGISTGVRA
ncbi:MAG: UDP-N-acetylglucosamine--N-acetylmuramyl-(pentapeptide) pyrophosphoryl-undecaprenol N-acetylglucosamine transferase [Rhodospirillales bacterium]|nr:UDP-N-acetylglucosamine--N-acetylmuramyl-(pentapeptide) pyrophosphoryl-undecaprenol N-acetylglucosamine transferase [Rhodospirillales bacterium]